MAIKSDEKQYPYILISTYEALYTERYGKKPTVNRYREKWGMQDVIDSVGFNRARELLQYYFKTGKNGHPLGWFFMNFDNIDRMLNQRTEDDENRKKLREQTKQMVKEMEKDEH